MASIVGVGNIELGIGESRWISCLFNRSFIDYSVFAFVRGDVMDDSFVFGRKEVPSDVFRYSLHFLTLLLKRYSILVELAVHEELWQFAVILLFSLVKLLSFWLRFKIYLLFVLSPSSRFQRNFNHGLLSLFD